MPIDASIPLGVKAPDQMQNLSSLLSAAKGAQDVQTSGMVLGERQAVQGILANPKNYTDPEGNINFEMALPAIMKAAPTTGTQYVQGLMTAQKQQTEAKQALNNLTTDVRAQAGSVLASIPPGTSPDIVNKTLDKLGTQYKGSDTVIKALRMGYTHSLQTGGQNAADDFVARAAREVLPQPTQQEMDTPTVTGVDNGQQAYGVNVKPGVRGMPIGAVVPGTSVQKQLPPNTPTVGSNNQPGYVGPQPVAQPGVNGNFSGQPQEIRAAIEAIKDPQERANARAAFEEQAQRTPGFSHGGGFVPSGPVPGANELKAGSIATLNQHWDNLNKQAENSQLLEGVLGNIKALAPGAITGTESGRKAYVNGLLNAFGLGNKATGDLQKDTDLLEKNIAQLGLNTPATTDAMRTIISAARPHGTMSQGAIEEAAAQVSGQIQANRAVRNALIAPKQIASQTGDPSVYESVRAHLEGVADPRAWQFQALPSKEAKAAMLSKLTPEDRATLRSKIEQLHQMGLLK